MTNTISLHCTEFRSGSGVQFQGLGRYLRFFKIFLSSYLKLFMVVSYNYGNRFTLYQKRLITTEEKWMLCMSYSAYPFDE